MEELVLSQFLYELKKHNMNKFEILLVRLVPIMISIYIGLVIIFAWNGISLYEYNYVFGHSLLIDLILLFLCLNQGRYHCRYLRFLIYNLLFTDLFGVIDAKFNLVIEATLQLNILSTTWLTTAIITIILAIKHFYKLNHKKWQRTK